MAHRMLGSLVFAGLEPTTAAMVISLLGDEGLPYEVRILEDLSQEPWHSTRTGLMVIGMTPETDLARVSHLIQSRTTWWEVVVCLVDVLANYEVALLAQGAAKVIRHPTEDLEGTANQLRSVLKSMNNLHTDAFGLEVSDLIQLFGEKRLDKTIRLTGGGTMGSIFMRAGNVLHAETIEGFEGMEAFRTLFSISGNAEMRVHKGCLSNKVSINMPAMSCLLEGSRVLDENAGVASGHRERDDDEPRGGALDLDDELELGDDHGSDNHKHKTEDELDLSHIADHLFEDIDLGDHDEDTDTFPSKTTPEKGGGGLNPYRASDPTAKPKPRVERT